MSDYNDIINLEHHTSKIHPRLSSEQRAAQFAPFAALVGYSDEVKEKARLTNKKIELDEDTLNNINTQLNRINEIIKSKPLITITYFVPDKKKTGGSYRTITDNVKRIDDVMKCIKLTKNIIYLEDVLLIEIED